MGRQHLRDALIARAGARAVDRRCAARPVQLERLAAALEASWDHRTAYRGITQPGNPAFGQCYPTSRLVQFFYPGTEIACGEVWTGASTECHFWNVRASGPQAEWIDLSWKQFPAGSVVRQFKLLDRHQLGDSPPTVERCALLLRRVLAHLGSPSGPAEESLIHALDVTLGARPNAPIPRPHCARGPRL